VCVVRSEFDELLAEPEPSIEKIQTILDADTEPWGIKVTKVEVNQIDLPQESHTSAAA
jgi:regulator of protease activity HflC (stomatin/prohibitin superfamily)